MLLPSLSGGWAGSKLEDAKISKDFNAWGNEQFHCEVRLENGVWLMTKLNHEQELILFHRLSQHLGLTKSKGIFV